ncbi:MAG: DUF4923 family protein [Clostridiales bacterium]|nr:DUF4923 family protein [Clostridiales bacterium]
MKNIRCALSLILVLAFVMVGFTACNLTPQSKIVGKWKDSTGLVGYEFKDDNTVKFSVLGVPVKGTYEMNVIDKTVTLTGTVLVKSISQTYEYEIKGSQLTLTDVSSGESTVYIRVEDKTTTAKPKN